MPAATVESAETLGTVRFFFPALLPGAAALAEILLCLGRHHFTLAAPLIHARIRVSLALASLLLAAVLSLWPRARQAVARHMEGLGLATRQRHVTWLFVTFVGVLGSLGFVKLWQYLAFELTSDSVATANICWNIIHRFSFACSPLGVENYFAVHFMPLLALMAPVLWIWNDIGALMTLNTLALSSLPVVAYCLTYRRTGSSLAGFAALWLVFTSPFLSTINSASVVPNVYVAIFFLWAAVAAEAGRWRVAAVFVTLMLLTIEQSCLVLLGLGAYAFVRLGPSQKRAWQVGAAVCAAAVVLLALELKLRWSFPDASRFPSTTWAQFDNLGQGPREALATFLAHPLRTASVIFWPPARLIPLLRMCVSTGFFPALEPPLLIPWLVGSLPSLLAKTGDYHELTLHYAAYVAGPLWWAAAAGVAWAYSMLSRRAWVSWLLPYVLLIGAVNLVWVTSPFWGGHSEGLFEEIPAVTGRIPQDATVWTYESASSWLAPRPFLKILPQPGYGDAFTAGLFVPDYVLIWRHLPGIDPDYQARLWTFLAKEGYVKAGETVRSILFRHPRAPLARENGRPPATELPVPGLEAKKIAASIDDFADPALALDVLKRGAEAGEAVAQYQLGLLYWHRMHDPREAEKWLRLAADQDNADATFILGTFYIGGAGGKPDPDAAIQWFGRAVNLGAPNAELNLAAVLFSQGRLDEAIVHFTHVIKTNPSSEEAYCDLGAVLLQRGRTQEAIRSFEQALRVNPRSSAAHNNWGAALEREKRLPEALEQFRQALALDPGNRDALGNIRAIQSRMGR